MFFVQYDYLKYLFKIKNCWLNWSFEAILFVLTFYWLYGKIKNSRNPRNPSNFIFWSFQIRTEPWSSNLQKDCWTEAMFRGVPLQFTPTFPCRTTSIRFNGASRRFRHHSIAAYRNSWEHVYHNMYVCLYAERGNLWDGNSSSWRSRHWWPLWQRRSCLCHFPSAVRVIGCVWCISI